MKLALAHLLLVAAASACLRPLPRSARVRLCLLLQIVVLDGGQVVESGTHKQLLSRGGRYAALVSAQELTLQQTLM